MAPDRSPDSAARSGRPIGTLTALEAAAALGLHERTIRRAISRGELTAQKKGGTYQITSPALERYRTRRAGAKMLPVASPPFAASPPQPLTPLIGREREIAAILALLLGDSAGETRLLTLTGAGGIGKTRLALAVANELQAHIAHGVIFVDLAPLTSPDLVIAAIASALSLRESNGSLLDQVKTELRYRRLLLILDNFEHVASAAPVASELLGACPGVRIIVTSRVGLRVDGEQIFPVAPLALPAASEHNSATKIGESAAVRLFLARARAVEPDFTLTDTDAPVVAAICHRLDGLPLAIELAAARVRHLALPTLLARIEGDSGDASLGLLVGGHRDRPPRLRSLKDAIAWSYDLLAPGEQLLFRRLAVFSGGFSLSAANALGNWHVDRSPDGFEISAASVLDALSALVDQSLLQSAVAASNEPRFLMLETLRAYALERLTEAAELAETRRRHGQWALSIANDVAARFYTAEDGAARAQISAELDNLRAALAWAVEQEAAETALPLATVLARVWFAYGQLNERRAWLERALALDPEKRTAPVVRARALGWLGALATLQGEYELAITVLEEARTLYQAIGDRAEVARMLLRLGAAAEYQGDDERATRWYEASLELFRLIGDSAQVSVLLENLSDAAYRRQDCALASALAEEALSAARDGGQPIIIAKALVGVAQSACVSSDYRTAALALRESLALTTESREKIGVADTLAACAGLAVAHGLAKLAARLLGATDALCAEIGAIRVYHLAQYQRALAATRDALGMEAFAPAWASGRHQAPANAVGEALVMLDQVAGGDEPALSLERSEAVPTTSVLTPREIDVLRLMAEGCSDREIGEALSIAQRTASNHVANILAKLRLDSRTAAAVYGVRSGLI